MNKTDLNHRLPAIVDSLVQSIHAQPAMKHLDRVLLPSRDAIIHSIDLLRQIVFPGYFGKQGLTTENVTFRIGELVTEAIDILYAQTRCCLRYREGLVGENGDTESCAHCDAQAAEIVGQFFDRIPEVR